MRNDTNQHWVNQPIKTYQPSCFKFWFACFIVILLAFWANAQTEHSAHKSACHHNPSSLYANLNEYT